MKLIKLTGKNDNGCVLVKVRACVVNFILKNADSTKEIYKIPLLYLMLTLLK